MRSLDPVQLGSIEQFCKAAELGSFTAAAEFLGLTPASVSRSIRRLEERLGVRLFFRSTRSVRLTPEGAIYQQECQRALEQISEAERLITGQQKVPSGLLRISVGTLYANYRLLPLIPEFTATYPQIELELSISNRLVDFVEEGYDLAVRLGVPRDPRLIAHKLEDASVGVFATPAYLARHGTPHTLAELEQHDCIQFELPSSGRRIAWLFDEEGREREVLTDGGYVCSDDVLGGVTLAKHGAGLFQTYRFIVERELAEGTLVEVLPAFGGRSRPFTLLYPQGRHMPLRLRAFIEFLMACKREWNV